MSLVYSDISGRYLLADYNRSHSQFLFRKYKLNENDFNVDIIFKAVFSLNIQIVFNGLKIFIERRLDMPTIVNPANRKFILKLIDNEGVISYMDCGALGIFENSLEYFQSSLGDNLDPERNKPILWLTDKEIMQYINNSFL
jgi:hypothetical protein